MRKDNFNSNRNLAIIKTFLTVVEELGVTLEEKMITTGMKPQREEMATRINAEVTIIRGPTTMIGSKNSPNLLITKSKLIFKLIRSLVR